MLSVIIFRASVNSFGRFGARARKRTLALVDAAAAAATHCARQAGAPRLPGCLVPVSVTSGGRPLNYSARWSGEISAENFLRQIPLIMTITGQ